MEVILLERISRLGNIGDTVRVKNGFARNFLLPQQKALRATEDNKKHFEKQRSALESQNNTRKGEAEKQAKTLEGVNVTIIRQAADDGKLYGSVSARDVADALQEAGYEVERRLIDLNASIKSIGVYTVTLNLHPEVQVPLKINVARNADSPLPPELLGEVAEEPQADDAEAYEAADAAEEEGEETA